MSDTAAELKIKLSADDGISPTMATAVAAMTEAANKMTESLGKVAEADNKTKEGHEGLHSGTINLAAAMEVLHEGLEIAEKAYELLEAQVEKAIEASVEATKAQNQLAGALVATGQYTSETADEIKDYAEQAMKMEGADVAVTESQIAMGVQMGLSVEKAEEMSEASRKLAAYTGGSVNEAFNTLKGSLTGHARQLALVLPQVKEFGTAQLKQGDAIDVVNQQLDAQYQLYQGSYAAGVAKANSAMQEVYVSVGDIITQNPIVQGMLANRAILFQKVAEAVKEFGEWVKDNQSRIEVWLTAFARAATVIGGAVGIIAAVTVGVTGLGAAFTFMTGPIGLTILAVSALTAAFIKWPGLFDEIIGGLKIMIGAYVSQMDTMVTVAMKVASIFSGPMAASLRSVHEYLQSSTQSWTDAGKKQIEAGIIANNTTVAIKAAGEQEKSTAADILTANSKINASKLAVLATYDGFVVGTLKQREQLEGEVQTEQKALKAFESYYNSKIQLAVSKENEQAAQVAAFRLKALKEVGASPTGKTQGDAGMAEETARQQRIQALNSKKLIDEKQFQSAMLGSQQAYENSKFQMEHESATQLAAVLGNTPAGFQARLALAKQHFQLERSQKMQQAQQSTSDAKLLAGVEAQLKRENEAKMTQDTEEYYNKQIAIDKQLEDGYSQTLHEIELQQAKHGQVMGAMQGVANSSQVSGVKDTLGNLSSLMSVHSKTAFQIGKQMGAAQAAISTYQAAIAAYAGMVIAFPGPVGIGLGVAAAAAAGIAGGIQIANIESQQYQGHAGMDEVPQSADNKSFTLSGGERVIQPEANKDLTTFLKGQNQGSGGGSGGVQTININVSAKMTPDDARGMTDMIITQLRAASERGTPIISDKAIIKSS